MKAGWVEKKLGEVCEFQRGLTYSKSDEVERSTNVVLRANNVDVVSGSLNFSDLKYINDEINVSENKKVKKDAVLICTASGSKSHLGKVAYVDKNYGYAFGGFMGQIISTQEVMAKYLFYSMMSCEYKQFISELSDGVNINNLKFDDLKNFKVFFPTLSEQQRIVALLDEAFASIDAAKVNAEQNLNNARALFDGYLAQVFVKQGPNWEMKTLQQVALDFGRGKSRHRPRNDPKLYGGVYPFVQTGDIRNADHVVATYTQTYNEVGLSQSKLWPKGTLCITIAANIAETGILDFEACFPDSVIGVVVNDKISSNGFVEYLLQSYKAQLQAKGKGSAQDNINMGTFENQLFPFPPLPEQQAIVARLDALSAETKKLEALYRQKIAALDELKQSLLHQAFTGEL